MFFIYLLILLVIEDEYSGPKLEDGKVTLDFMVSLMEHYKQQKKLHRKYAYKVIKCMFFFNSTLKFYD